MKYFDADSNIYDILQMTAELDANTELKQDEDELYDYLSLVCPELDIPDDAYEFYCARYETTINETF